MFWKIIKAEPLRVEWDGKGNPLWAVSIYLERGDHPRPGRINIIHCYEPNSFEAIIGTSKYMLRNYGPSTEENYHEYIDSNTISGT